MTSADAMVRAMRRALVCLLFLELLRSLIFVRENQGSYSPAWLEWTAFGLLVAVAAVLAVLTIGGQASRAGDGVRLPLVLVTLSASVLATAAVRSDSLLTGAHWSWFMLGWFLVVIELGRPFRELVRLLELHLVLVVGQVAWQGGLTRHHVAELVIRGVAYTGAQLAFGAAGTVTERSSRTAARISEREEGALTRQRIADQLLQDHRDRHQAIAATAIPLLRGLADGDLSPDDETVRRRCLVEAGRLRRLMAESDQDPNPLNHELRACVDVAERAGVQVDVAFRGTNPSTDRDGRRRLTEPVIAVLAEARGFARLTVVGSEQDVVVSVLASVPETDPLPDPNPLPGTAATGRQDRPAEPGPGPGPGYDVAVTVLRSPGRIWMTARWERA